MFADELRRAAEAAPRVKLPDVAKALWSAFAAGHLTEAEAEVLSILIEARRAVPVPVRSEAPPRRVGSRPRTDASMERRRRWAASGRLPPGLAARFTLAEQAVLAVVAVEVAERGDCRLAVGRLAAVAGVAESTVRRAVRAARDLGLLGIEERRLSTWRSDTNVVRIISAEWTAWLRLGRAGGGCQSRQGTTTRSSSKALVASQNDRRRASDGGEASSAVAAHPERLAGTQRFPLTLRGSNLRK